MRSCLVVEHVDVDCCFITAELYINTAIPNIIVSIFTDITDKKPFNCLC